MVSGQRVIKWSKAAGSGLVSAIGHIMTDSPQNAEKVNKDILAKVYDLPANPERYSPDKYKYDNDGSYRAFELHHYRIASCLITSE